MNRPSRIVACALAAFLTTRPALALNDTIAVTVGTGTTKTANLISFSGGNVISEAGICDATTANQCATVSAGGLLSVAATLNAETTKVIGTVNQGTSPWIVAGTGTLAVQNTPQAPALDRTVAPTSITTAGTANLSVNSQGASFVQWTFSSFTTGTLTFQLSDATGS